MIFCYIAECKPSMAEQMILIAVDFRDTQFMLAYQRTTRNLFVVPSLDDYE